MACSATHPTAFIQSRGWAVASVPLAGALHGDDGERNWFTGLWWLSAGQPPSPAVAIYCSEPSTVCHSR
jgi:hypothetical protein